MTSPYSIIVHALYLNKESLVHYLITLEARDHAFFINNILINIRDASGPNGLKTYMDMAIFKFISTCLNSSIIASAYVCMGDRPGT